MKGWLAVVNPNSGGNRRSICLQSIVEKLRPLTERMVFTRYPGHAQELAMQAPDCHGFAIVGGDGTLFEVLRGIDPVRQAVAVFPTGRGNSLARDLGLGNTVSTVEAVNSGTVTNIDLMDVTIEHAQGVRSRCRSASTVAVGYPARVTQTAARYFAQLGVHSYTAAASIESLRRKPFEATVRYDERPVVARRLTGLIVNNTRHIANFLAFPQANCSDGLLDVMELNAGRFRQNLHNISASSRLGFYTPAVAAPASSIEVSLAATQDLMVDGEIYSDVRSFMVRTLPGALRCYRAARRV